MIRIAAIIAASVFLPAVSYAEQAIGPDTVVERAAISASETVGRVYVVKGGVFVSHDNNPANQVAGSESLASNSLVSTVGNSSALLKFEDGQVVTMQANSSFHVREYRYDAKKIENSAIAFSMLKGGMRFLTGLIGQKKKEAFRLTTPYSTIGIRGTEFMVAMVDNSMYSKVLSGKIGLTNAAGTAVVGSGQVSILASSSSLASVVSASAIPSGVFDELLSIPVQPSAIPAQPAAPAEAPPPVATPSSLPGVAPAVIPAPSAGGAAVVGATLGVAGGALAAIASSDSDSAETRQSAPSVASHTEHVEKNKAEVGGKSSMALSGKIGLTTGYGAELTKGGDNLGGRVGFNKFNTSTTGNADSMDFDFKLQLQSVSALADWYPFEGKFRISAGLYNNKNKIEMTAKPDAGATYTINNQIYPANTAVSSLQGRLTFKPTAPYLGIGWGNPVSKGKGWGMVSDVGVIFQGAPQYTLTVTCAAGYPGCAQLQADVAAEQAKQQDDLNNSFKYWPILSIGLSYQW